MSAPEYTVPNVGRLKLKRKNEAENITPHPPKRKAALNKDVLLGGSVSPSKRQYKPGSGRVVSIGEMLQGLETEFMVEIEPGDVIGLNHPSSLVFEERRVQAVLSQRSLTLAEKFSGDLVSTCTYYICKEGAKLKRKVRSKLEKEGNKAVDEAAVNEELQRMMEPSSGRSSLSVREKTGMWGYKNVSQQLDKEYSTEELLNMRIKKSGRDKYC